MNRRILFNLILAVLVALSLPGVNIQAHQAVKTGNDPLGKFEGVWKGEGKFFGMDANAVAKWEWVLGGKFLRLAISYEMKTPDGKKQTFEGHGYYKPKGEGKYEGRWFDSQGNSYPISGTLENGVLTSQWGESGNYNGRSTYRLNETDKTLEVVDSSKQKDGSWKEFSRFRLTPAH